MPPAAVAAIDPEEAIAIETAPAVTEMEIVAALAPAGETATTAIVTETAIARAAVRPLSRPPGRNSFS